MANKPNILATFKRGQSIGAVDHFVDTMNWIVGFTSNIKGGDGIKFKDEKTDHPTIEANLIAGSGIKITESNGALKISLSANDDDDSGSGSTKTGGGNGSGSGGGGGGSGSITPPQPSPTPSPSPSPTPSPSPSPSPSPTPGSGCNTWSEGMGNDSSDFGLGNPEDNCNELNGW